MRINVSIILSLITLLLLSSFSCAEVQNGVEKKLHKASESIKSSANYKLITASLFGQIRPRANITKEELTTEEIDKKVHTYVSEKYAPVLIKNYSQIYLSMKQQGKDFTDCNSPIPIKESEDVLQALCYVAEGDGVKVRYMTNGYSQGWKIAAIFQFGETSGGYELIAIDIQLTDGQKVYVDGI